MPAFITDVAAFLPHRPVDNSRIESVLGMLNGVPSAVKDLVLERNGIKWRYYAVDPASGQSSYSNAELTAEAVKALMKSAGKSVDGIEVLACGTSSPDQVIPNHAAMVHGLLKNPPCEILSAAGVCCSSVVALKYAVNGIKADDVRCAVVTGSELASSALRATQFPRSQQQHTSYDNPYIGFNQEFLRFMLSDGAGAMLLQAQPNDQKLSLRVDWLDIRSFADQLDTCMYSGARKQADGTLQGWRSEADGIDGVLEKGYFNLSQDVELLGKEIVNVAGQYFADVCQRRGVQVANIRWMLPHLSSMFFQQPLYDKMCEHGVEIPLDRWFTNLKYKGNTGSASIIIILEELMNSGKLQRGDQLLCVVPESARFTFACLQLTVV